MSSDVAAMIGWFDPAKEYRLALENVYVERWKLSHQCGPYMDPDAIAIVYSVV